MDFKPKGFSAITPYFQVENGQLFTDFVVQAFGAEIWHQHHEDGKLRHFAYKIGGAIIEGSEVDGTYPTREIAIHLYVEDCDAVFKKAIDAGGTEVYPVADMPYGERSGGVTDPCGNHWYIATQLWDMYPDEG
ncbi:MAG: VOC family protein [Pyrinomonadaceae bacterium]